MRRPKWSIEKSFINVSYILYTNNGTQVLFVFPHGNLKISFTH